MRFIIGGAVVFLGIVVVGLSYHDTLKDAWGALSQ